MRTGTSGASRAFTLIEVMVALAILAIAAVVMTAAYLNVLTAYEKAGQAGDLDRDLNFARAQLMSEKDPKKVEDGAEFEGTGGRRVRWKAKLEPTNLPDLFEVNFSCELTGGEKKRDTKTEERFRLLRPTWSEDAEREKLRAEITERIEKFNTAEGFPTGQSGDLKKADQ